jgi:hypothetical protein
MTLPQFIGTTLNANATVTALVGTRINHGDRPQSVETLPAINYFGPVGVTASSGVAAVDDWQVSGHAATALEAHNLQNAITGALVGLNAGLAAASLAAGYDVQGIKLGSAASLQEPEAGIFSVAVTLRFVTAATLV